MAGRIDRVDGATRHLSGRHMIPSTGYPTRLLIALWTLLAMVWLLLCSPWPWGWNAFLGVLALMSAVIAGFAATRRARVRQKSTQQVLHEIDGALSALPAGIKRNTPLMLAVGTPGGFVGTGFGKEVICVTDTAIWVRVSDPTRLMHFADALKRWRDGQGPDAVAYLIDADSGAETASLMAEIRRWRSAIGEASRAVGYSLPACIAIYGRELQPTSDDCPWFGASGPDTLAIEALPELISSRLTQYAGTAIPEDREPRARRAARLDVLTRWACEAVLPALLDEQRAMRPVRVQAFGVVAIEGHPATDSPLARFATTLTGLTLPTIASTPGPSRCPLPEPLIRGIAAQTARRALPRALAHAFAALVALFCAAAAASAWQNRGLVERVRDDIAHYRAIPSAMDTARVDALKAVKQDRDELAGYARSGVPPRLGLGFYRAGPLLQVTDALIAGYQPPAPPASTIELDSLSLFKSGSAVLNPGSNRVLVGALEMIRAHQDKRVLVAGHTDTVGNASSNLALSEARAASVRNWLADASGIPTSHFAIQGYGDTRPKATNNTEAGRAANRRVEITLVPDCRDDRKNGASPEGYKANVACSFN
jgi:outer membrane protein OmpA-like peptidoglycan-associated protein